LQVFHRIDTISGLSALAVHAVVAAILVSIPPPPPHSPTTVDVEIKTPPPKPPEIITPPKPPEPEPEKKVIPKVKVAPPPEATPPPNKTPPPEPPKEPPKPVFGLPETAMSNEGDGPAMPTGNTTMIDPKNSGKHTGAVPQLPAGTPGPAKPEYKPVADVYIKSLPEIDSEACARMVTYPSEAEQLGIEGEVKLRVSLDESGKVHDIKVMHGLGHGLDQAAMNALKYKCKFKPAIGTDGKPAAYVIQTYTWTFELPR
jgi:protein TonB